jgi:tRNA (mo5U34)-methyltransferase
MQEDRWYHTIELPGGQVTPGYFDTRAAAQVVPLPPRLDGARCLDVGTYDGFWAFEMERRGAAEVIAIDVLDPLRWDWPRDSPAEAISAISDGRRGFDMAREALGSSVSRRDLSVYDLDPEELGTFDVVYCGSLTLHLRDPVRALERIRSVCTGVLVYEDAIDVPLSLLPRTPRALLDGRGRPWWWKLNPAGLARVAEAAGFEVVAGPIRFWMPFGAGGPRPSVRWRSLASRTGREAALLARRGDPHAAVLARPA